MSYILNDYDFFKNILIILGDIIHANDVLDEVFAKYNRFVAEKNLKGKESKRELQSNSDALLDFAGSTRPQGDKPKNRSDVIDELGDIFSSDGATTNIAEPLKPVNVMPTGNS